MQSYPIYFSFRSQQGTAIVHKHYAHYQVWFTDSEIMKDFGGLLVFDNDGAFSSGRSNMSVDKTDFFRAVTAQLK